MGRPIRTATRTVIDDGSLGANWTVTGGVENAPASITLPDGTTGSRASFTQTSATNMFITCTTALTVTGKRGLEIDLYVEGCTDGTIAGYQADFRVRDAGSANTYVSDVYLQPGWNRIRLGKGNLPVSVGAPNWQSTTFVDIVIKIVAITAQSLKVWVSDLAYSGWARPQIAITFDDGYTEVINTAKAILDTYGFKATVGVISSLVGTGGKMSLANLNTLHDAGWAMCNHTDTHGAAPFLNAASQATCLTEISTCQAYLLAQGFTRDNEHLHFMSPYGETSTNYFAANAQAGSLAFMGLGVANNLAYTGFPSSDCWVTSGMSPSSAYPRLNIINTWTAAQVLAYVDRCIMSGKSMIINLHKIKAEATSLDWTAAKFTTLAAGLYARSAMLDVVTVPEYFSRIMSPTT